MNVEFIAALVVLVASILPLILAVVKNKNQQTKASRDNSLYEWVRLAVYSAEQWALGVIKRGDLRPGPEQKRKWALDIIQENFPKLDTGQVEGLIEAFVRELKSTGLEDPSPVVDSSMVRAAIAGDLFRALSTKLHLSINDIEEGAADWLRGRPDLSLDQLRQAAEDRIHSVFGESDEKEEDEEGASEEPDGGDVSEAD